MRNTNRKMQKQAFKKRLYRYIVRLVKFLSKLPKTPVIREIVSQVMRSGTSIGANFFEAEGASSKKDFKNFFNHCLKSANETRFWLSVLRDCSLVSADVEELANIFASSILTMKGRRKF